MSAYGTLKLKSAWKMYAKSVNIEFEIANKVSRDLERYEIQCRYEDDVDLWDYVDKEYEEYIKMAKQYLGIVDNLSPSPCAYLVVDDNIKELIGVTKTKNALVCNIPGNLADAYGFLKEDLLTVAVVDIIDKTFKKIGMDNWKEELPSAKLKEITKADDEVWRLYSDGATVSLNQVDGASTTQKAMKYKPESIEELCSFVAAIRPGFKSMYSIYENREDYSYNIDVLDDLLHKSYPNGSFMLYQENAMQALLMAGIPPKDTYQVIKAISKKKTDLINSYKEKFLDGFTDMLMEL